MVRSTNDLSCRHPSWSRRSTMQSPNEQLATPKARPIQTRYSEMYMFPRLCRAALSNFARPSTLSLKAKVMPQRSWALVIEFQCSMSLQNMQKLLSHTFQTGARLFFKRTPEPPSGESPRRTSVTRQDGTPRPAANLGTPEAGRVIRAWLGNDPGRRWTQRGLQEHFGELRGPAIAAPSIGLVNQVVRLDFQPDAGT